MELKELTESIGELYEENKIKKVFTLLKKEVKTDSVRRSGLSHLCRQFNEYNENKIANTIRSEDANIEIGKIGRSLLLFVESLEQIDLGSEVICTYQEIANPILIFTKTEEVNNILEFFLQLNFVSVNVKPYTFDDYQLNDFDLIIFDNQDLPDCPSKKPRSQFETSNILIRERINIMETVLEKSPKPIIHFGNFLSWINHNRDRVQAANSKFSLHARTKEVIDFINAYRV